MTVLRNTSGTPAQLEVPTSGQHQPPGHSRYQGTAGRAVASVSRSFLNTVALAPGRGTGTRPFNAHFTKCLFRANQDLEGKSRGTPTHSSLSSHPRIAAAPLPFLLLVETDLWEAGERGALHSLWLPWKPSSSVMGLGAPGGEEGLGLHGSLSGVPPVSFGWGRLFP